VPGERDRVRCRSSAGADHQPVEREPCALVGRHHRLALSSENEVASPVVPSTFEAVTAGIEQEACELGRTRRIGRAGVVDRQWHGGDDAGEFIAGHGGSSRGE